uniref:Cysteine-rich transmembrane CYSTM domain-containing protein n=1 Tax=Rhipicephalus zambeziensis TaxID=60191 RepID=A0A224YAJ6_9ACAR
MSYGYPQAQHQYQPPPAPGFAPPQQMPPPGYPGYPPPQPAPVAEPYFAASAPVGDTYQPPPAPVPQNLYPMQQQPGSYYVPPAPPATVIVKEKEDSCAKDCCLCALCMGLCCLCCQD